jgi:hypothetical protein
MSEKHLNIKNDNIYLDVCETYDTGNLRIEIMKTLNYLIRYLNSFVMRNERNLAGVSKPIFFGSHSKLLQNFGTIKKNFF